MEAGNKFWKTLSWQFLDQPNQNCINLDVIILVYCKSVQQLQCSNKRTLTDKSSTEDLKVNCCKGRGQIWRCDTTTIWRDFFALSVRLFCHPRPKFEEFSQNRKENVTKSNICFFRQNNLITGKLRENWSSRNSFFYCRIQWQL